MNNTDLCFMSAVDMAAAIRSSRISPVEIVDALFERIHALNPSLNAYCTLAEDSARQAAREAEAAVAHGEKLGLLHGVPVSIKDLLFTAGLRTMRGSPIYQNFVPEENAPSVAQLKAAGAIIIGKTATPEFGWKGTTDSPVSGISYNPWNLERSCGGSSGGAAAAVAAGIGPLAVGTDGAGSIRIPASFCGIVGLKASYGRVAVYPPSPLGFLTHAGPMARTTRDTALMLQVIAGPDERDLGSLPPDHADYLDACVQELRGLRIAWSPDLGHAPVDPEVARICATAAGVFTELGCTVEQADPGFADLARPLQVLWASGLAHALRSALPEWADQMDQGLVEMIRAAAAFTAADYTAALAQRIALWDTMRRFYERYDLLITPTMPTTAFAPGPTPLEVAGRAIYGFGYTPFTFPFNLTGQPAITVPCGFAADGLPVGVQIVGPRFADALVLRAAAAFERARPWIQRRP